MREEMSNLSRVKGEERPLFRHMVREKQAYDTMLVLLFPFRPMYGIDIQGEGTGTGEPPSDTQAIHIIHFGCESALPRATRRLASELVVNTKLTGQIR